MAGDVSPKDLQTLQDGLIDGMITPENLPGNVRDKVYQYMGGRGIDMSNPNSQITQAQLAALKQQREANDGGIFDSKIFKPIEWIGSKLYQAYSATVSPAVSFAGIEMSTFLNDMNPTGYQGKDYMHDQGMGFSDAWELAHHISPGQSWTLLTQTPGERQKAGVLPQDILKQEREVAKGTFRGTVSAADPFGTMTNLDKYFSDGPAKYVSGAADLGISWEADPLVLGGKAAGAAKLGLITRPVAGQIAKETAQVTRGAPALTPEIANSMAWDNFTSKQPFQKLTDHFMKIKSANSDTAAAVMLREPTLRKSANGPAVASLLSQAKDQTEVANVLRVTMGDNVANEALKVQNGELAYQIDQVQSRLSNTSTYYNGLSDAEKISPMGLRAKSLMDAQTRDIATLDAQSRIVSDKIDAFGTLGNMNFNRVTTPAGLKIRNAWEQSRQWQPMKDGGFIGSRVNNIYSLSLGGVVKLAHTYNDIKPTHYIDLNDDQGYKQLNASLTDVKSLTPQARDMYVSQYLNASAAERPMVLQTIEQKIARNIVDRYNLRTGEDISHEVADGLYREIAAKRGAAQGSMRNEQFGTTSVADPNNPGLTLRVDEITPDGGKTVVTPLLRSQMANGHSMMDFKLFEKAINANASTWQKALNQSGNAWTKIVALPEYVGTIWKFSQLFRLGYGPRALSDDALGQIARFGPMAMMDRAIKGGKYSWEGLRRAAMPDNYFEAAHVTRSNLEIQISDLEKQQQRIQQDMTLARNEGRNHDVVAHQDELNVNMDMLADVRNTYADMDSLVKGGQAMKHQEVGGQLFAPAYAGAQGGLFRDLASGEKNFQNMMGSSADMYLNQLRRMNWEQLSPAKHGADVHMEAWLKVVNQQVAHDELAVGYLKGKTPDQLERWLNTPEGVAYKRDHQIAQHLPHDQLVDRVTSQVDEWLNPAFPAGDAIRQAAARGEVTEDMLKQIPEPNRPLVNGQALSYARGGHAAMKAMDRFMSGFYNIMGNMPAKYLLRNPLFAQRYGVHLRDLMETSGKSGATHITEDLRLQMESAARKRALDDVKKTTFTMDYETKMSYMLRNFGAFFGAQQESWNRWARIISDKPDILPRVAQVMGAPTRAGVTTDQNGYKIAPDGTVTMPDGSKRLVPYNERNMVIQVPDHLGGKAFKKFFGLDKNATFNIPMSTANIILNHGDGPIPVSAGPYVQIAADHIAKNSPKVADMFQQLGILPFGVNDSELETFLPNWYRKSEQGDPMSDSYQQNLFYIMQAENYKYMEGLRKTKPTWTEIDSRAKKQSLMKTLFAMTLPISLQARDPYDFFRQQYRAMQKVDPDTADQRFYDKFGDAAFVFSQSLSKNNSGLRPTAEAVHMSKYYQDLITKVGPEYAGLIVGADQEGKYSNGAYHYELTHATDPASGKPMREKMSARDAMAQANLAKGWMQYKSQMNTIYAELYQQGFQSFDDPGAEDLKLQKQAAVAVLSEPQIVNENGDLVSNPYYNADWSKAYNQLDVNYFDRQAVALKQVVNDPEIWSKAVNPDGSIGMRSDIYWLKSYLAYRDDAKRALLLRKADGGSSDINAQENADIKGQWNSMVVAMIQQSTTFGDLFTRYLSRDMGFDQNTVQQEQTAGTLGQFTGNVQDQTANQSIFDVMANEGTAGGQSVGGLSTPSFDNTNTFGG